MKMNILITGVGGQGTVLSSRILAQAAQDMGFFVTTAETIGMAQRGGSVLSHVRIGQKDVSPLIPEGKADLIIAFEPAEAVRALPYLAPGGSMLVNTREVIPVTCAENNTYDKDAYLAHLKTHVTSLFTVDTEERLKALGSYKVLNTVMLGQALKFNLLPFSKEDLGRTITRYLPEKFHQINKQALDA